MRKRSHGGAILWMALVVFGLGMAGCSMENPMLSAGPDPKVEDCALIGQGTPSKYICGGKTLTSNQLADIRNPSKPDAK
jgi:hypothetical protein